MFQLQHLSQKKLKMILKLKHINIITSLNHYTTQNTWGYATHIQFHFEHFDCREIKETYINEEQEWIVIPYYGYLEMF